MENAGRIACSHFHGEFQERTLWVGCRRGEQRITKKKSERVKTMLPWHFAEAADLYRESD